jgi:hypothetical protein
MTDSKTWTLVLAAALLVLPGCGREDAPGATTRGGGHEVTTANTEQPALRAASLDPGVTIVGVDRLIRNQMDYTGLLAVQGVVVQCHEQRGAFVMVDVEEFKTCGFEACTDAAMPVRIARDQYDGALPQPGQAVTLVGTFEALERGFQFDLHEVHRNGSVILAQQRHEDP